MIVSLVWWYLSCQKLRLNWIKLSSSSQTWRLPLSVSFLGPCLDQQRWATWIWPPLGDAQTTRLPRPPLAAHTVHVVEIFCHTCNIDVLYIDKYICKKIWLINYILHYYSCLSLPYPLQFNFQRYTVTQIWVTTSQMFFMQNISNISIENKCLYNVANPDLKLVWRA